MRKSAATFLFLAIALSVCCAFPVRVVESNPIPIDNPKDKDGKPIPLLATVAGSFEIAATEPGAAPIKGKLIPEERAQPVTPVTGWNVPWEAILAVLGGGASLAGFGWITTLLRTVSTLRKTVADAYAYGDEIQTVRPADGDAIKAVKEKHMVRQIANGTHEEMKKGKPKKVV